MQYLMNVIHDSRELAPDDEMDAIGKFNDGMQKDGYLVFAGGLGFPEASTATVFDNRASAGFVSDGPFVESKEFIVGFDLLECESMDEAIQIAAAHPMARHGRIEIRASWPLNLDL